MTIDKTHLIVFCVGIFLGLCTGFFTGKAFYDKPLNVGIKRDTVIVTDTVTHYLPTPKDSIRTKFVTRFLPIVRTDTVTQSEVSWLHDTVAVEVPITSKHYGNEQYDAYISGFEPNLDSINVYQRTEYITETITLTKNKRKPWGIGFTAGYGYDFNTKTASPYVGVGISYDIISF